MEIQGCVGLYYLLLQMESNQDKVSSILDAMEKQNDPQALSEGLNILVKLIANITSSPFDQKYRGIKTTNNTIKAKLMGLKNIDQLLKTLGYTRQNDEMLTLKDQQFADFLQGEAQVGYRQRLLAAKLNSPADYEKELLLIKEKKQNKAEQKKRNEEAQRLKDKCKYDQQERAHMKVDQSKSNQLAFGSKANTFKDIGVDLCAKKSG